MPAFERKNVLDGLKSGKIQIVTSCGILTEGFDEPSIDVIVMARPTKSSGLYIQCVGRGLRLWPGKENCFVLDFTDRGHNLDTVMTLSSTIPDADAEERGEFERFSPDERDNTPKVECLESCDKEFDILGSTRFIWVEIGEDEWSLIDDEKQEIIMHPSENGYQAVIYFTDGSSKQIVSSPLPLEYCSGVCEDYARRHLKIAFANAKAPWMTQEEPLTKGQREYLEKCKAFSEGMTKAEASIEIRKITAQKNKRRRVLDEEPITDMQKIFLDRRGFDTSNMTKFQAMQAISKIKQSERAAI